MTALSPHDYSKLCARTQAVAYPTIYSDLMFSLQMCCRERFVATGLFFVLAVGIVGWIAFDALYVQLVTYGPGSDVWEHLTTLKAWSESLLSPVHPHTGLEASSARFTPLYFIYALFLKISGVSVFAAYGAISVFQSVMFVMGVFWFTRAYFRSDWAPFFALVILLCVWGTGWGWSNAYQLRSLILVAGYPSTGVFALSFMLFSWTLRLCRGPRLSKFESVGYMFLVGVIWVSHPLTAVFATVGAVLLIVFEKRDDQRALVKLGGLVFAGFVLAGLWPYYSLFGVLFKDNTQQFVNVPAYLKKVGLGRLSLFEYPQRGVYFYDWQQMIGRGGFALLGGLSCVLMAFVARFRWLAAVEAFMMLPFIVNMVVPVPLGHRFLFYGLVMGHLSMVGGAVLFWEYAGKSGRRPLAVAIQGTILVCLGVALYTEVQYSLRSYSAAGTVGSVFERRQNPLKERFEELATHLNASDVVLADPRTAFGLPAFEGKVVASLRGMHLVEDRNERKLSLRIFFDENSRDEDRERIVDKYKPTHILFSQERANDALVAYCERIGQRIEVSINDHFFVLR